ncbi:MAG: hypothetical protein WC456_03730 [Patescibacteria group bacterium]
MIKIIFIVRTLESERIKMIDVSVRCAPRPILAYTVNQSESRSTSSLELKAKAG